MSGGVTDRDHGAKAMIARLRELAAGRIARVGVLDDAPKDLPEAKPAEESREKPARVQARGKHSKKSRTRKKVAKRVEAAKKQRGPAKTLFEVAMIHEFGAGHVPQRSFIRATIDENRSEITRLQVAVAKHVLLGNITAEQGLDQIGTAVVGMVQTRIEKGIAPPLAASTKKAKAARTKRGDKKDTPLILTGQLLNSVTWRTVEAA